MPITISGSGITSSEIASNTITSGNLADGTITNADINASAAFSIELKDYSETYNGSSGNGSITLDLENGNVFQHTASAGNVIFVFSNPPTSGKAGSFTLLWIQDSTDRTITWPISVKWAGGTAPTVTSGAGKKDLYTFTTWDAGTTWYGMQAAADLS
jgi:hypothetical protein